MTSLVLADLFIASLLSATLYVILKYFQRFGVYNLHGLTFNYLTAATFSYLLNFEKNNAILHTASDFIPATLAIGALFISVFYIAAITAQKVGIAVTSIAGKMSMVIPIIAGVVLYGDGLDMLRITGMLVALAAVFLSTWQPQNTASTDSPSNRMNWLLPLLLFIGSGMVDTCIKISEHHFIDAHNQNLYFTFLFGSAGIIGLLLILREYFHSGKGITLRSISGGVILGITNYYSLDFLIRVLAEPTMESSLAFALSNVMVVLISSAFALFLFREKLNKLNLAGIGLALISIYILSR